MNLNLGANERIIKSWDYAAEREGKDENQATLTVTNKRLISSISNSHKYQYTEVPLGSVRRIDAIRDKKSNIGGIILIVFAVLIAIGVIIGAALVSPAMLASLVLSVVFIVVGIKMMGKGSFYIMFSLIETQSDTVEIGANNSGFKKKNTQSVQVKIDFSLVDDMLTTIGAVIFDDYEESDN